MEDGPIFPGHHHSNVVFSTNIKQTAHNEKKRYLTLREHLYLMGMPHTFKLENPKDYLHIGQVSSKAVPFHCYRFLAWLTYSY